MERAEKKLYFVNIMGVNLIGWFYSMSGEGHKNCHNSLTRTQFTMGDQVAKKNIVKTSITTFLEYKSKIICSSIVTVQRTKSK